MEWNEIKKFLEPITLTHYTSPEIHIQISIAISLKRIADSLEQKKVMSADEALKFYAGRDGC